MAAYDCLVEAKRNWPDRVLVEFWDRQFTAAQLHDDALRIAAALAHRGIRAGEAIGAVIPNIPSFVPVHFGILMAGGVFVPFNVLLTPREIAYQVHDSRLRAIFVFEMFLDPVLAALDELATRQLGYERPLVIVIGESRREGTLAYADLLAESAEGFESVVVEDAAPLQIVYTSGTTGSPKGALITGSNLRAMLEMMKPAFPMGEGDKFLCILPLFHVFALNSILHPAVHQGATVVLQPRWELGECVEALTQGGITMFAGVPTMYFYILEQAEKRELSFPQLKYCISGGAPMPLDVMERFQERFGLEIYEGYGLSETTVCVAVNRPGMRRPGSVGRPFDGLEIRVVDDAGIELPPGAEGEILVRGATVTPGYLNRPEETAEAVRDGWLYTGDIGHLDADGYLYIVDRKKDMILKGGFNIYPREIEELLYAVPQVAEAAVIGVPNAAKGEDVAAVVALHPGATLTTAELQSYLEPRLARYKLPKFFGRLDTLPKGITGKILKRTLRDQWPEIPPLK